MSTTGAARTPAIAGFLVAGAAVLLIGFFLDDRDPSATGRVSPLRIVEPVTGDVVSNPVSIRFVTPAPLRLTAAGWAAGPLHLHLIIDGRELMPAAADMTSADGTFAWRLPPLAPGPHRIHLTWAGRHHGIVAAATDTITLHIER